MNTNEIKRIAFEVTHKQIGVFEEVFEAPIFVFLEKVSALIDNFERECIEVQCCRESIFRELANSMLEMLIDLNIRTFLSDLYNSKEMLSGETAEDRYLFFINQFLSGKYNSLYSDNSELAWLNKNRINLTIYAIEEFLDRLKEDRIQISNELGINIVKLRKFSIGSGDCHNKGRNVYVLYVNESDHIVYKPHSVTNDRLFAYILEWFNKCHSIRAKLRHPKVVVRDGYGWQEFVKFGECETTAQANSYMYRMGCFLFVSYLTGCTDLHVENLIACGEHPMIIDTETMFFNAYSFRGMTIGKNDAWSKEIALSVFSSLLLPFDLISEKKLDYVDISGILGGVKTVLGQTVKKQIIINNGTDKIMFSMQEVPVDLGEIYNVAHLQGQQLHAGDYIEYVVSGFSDAYMAILTDKEAFYSYIKQLPFESGVYRQIFRNTNLYGRYLLASYHPNYVTSSKSRYDVFSRLKGKGDYISKEHEEFVMMEIDQLMNDDIPCFYTRYDSKNLYSVYGDVIRQFYGRTIREQFQSKIQNLNEIDLYKQTYFVRCAIANENYDRSLNLAYRVPSHVLNKPSTFSNAISFMKWIYRFRETYHRLSSNNNIPQYYCITLDLDHRRIEVESPDLYAGIGSALFYMQLNNILHSDYSKEAALLAENLGQVDFKADMQKSNYVGIFNGIGSRIYLNYYAYRFYGDKKYCDRLNSLCDMVIEKVEQDIINEYDVISGYAGLIIFALKAWEKDKQCDKLLELAKKCGEKLLKQYDEATIPVQSGFAHGYAGISTALIMLGTVIRNSAYYDAGIELVHREFILYNPNTDCWHISEKQTHYMNAWCYGFAGILVARTTCLDYVVEADTAIFERDIEICLRHIIEDITNQSGLQILCHGISGNLDILLWYARKTTNNELLKRVEQGTLHLLDGIRDKGIIFEHTAKVPNISFMTGLSGLGYYLERFVDVSIPSVLALEVL